MDSVVYKTNKLLNMKYKLNKTTKTTREAYKKGYIEGFLDLKSFLSFIETVVIPQVKRDVGEKKGRKAWIQGNIISFKKPSYKSAVFDIEEVFVLTLLTDKNKKI